MDRKGIIILILSFMALLMWPALMKKLYPPAPLPVVQPSGTNEVVTSAGTNIAEISNIPTNRPAPVVTPKEVAPPEQLLVLTNDLARYTFTSHGGGLKLVELMKYPARVSKRARTLTHATNWASLNTLAPLPVMALADSQTFVGNDVFQLSHQGNVVRAEKALTNGLTLVKEFHLLTNYLVDAVTRLENRSSQPMTIPPQQWVTGTATPMGLADDLRLLGTFWYDGKAAHQVQAGWFANRTLGCFPGTPRHQFTGGKDNVEWVAVHNQFFALAAIAPTNMPATEVIVREVYLPPLREPTNALAATERSLNGRDWLFAAEDFSNLGGLAFALQSSTDSLSQYVYQHLSADTRAQLKNVVDFRSLSEPMQQALVADLNDVLHGPSIYQANQDYFLRHPLPEQVRRLVDQTQWPEDVVRLNRLILEQAYTRDLKPSPMGYQTSMVYPATVLQPQGSVAHSFLIYAGPKEYKLLSRLGARLKNNLDKIMSFGFFGWFAQLLLVSMNGLNAMGFSYGWAIITITIIIKGIFWPLTNISTRSMKRMSALQPQIKALQEKFKDDPQKMQRKMWEFYKEHKINPAAGCLPVMVQMPIFFGFYTMIRTAIELRGASWLWISDLSQPDTLFIIPGLNVPFNLLPLIMGATMLWQARLTPASPGVDPMQQKVMRYMPLMFLVILYNFSAGLTLYWTVQNLLSVVQTKLTRAADKNAPLVPKAPVPVVPQKKKRR